MNYATWSTAMCLLSLPPLLCFTIHDISKRWRSAGQFPLYWAVVHAAAYFVLFTPTIMASYRIQTIFIVNSLILALSWAGGIYFVKQWIKQRRKMSRSDNTPKLDRPDDVEARP